MPRRMGEEEEGAGAAKEKAELESRAEAVSAVPPPKQSAARDGWIHAGHRSCLYRWSSSWKVGSASGMMTGFIPIDTFELILITSRSLSEQ